jgi:hypothetical protein
MQEKLIFVVGTGYEDYLKTELFKAKTKVTMRSSNGKPVEGTAHGKGNNGNEIMLWYMKGNKMSKKSIPLATVALENSDIQVFQYFLPKSPEVSSAENSINDFFNQREPVAAQDTVILQ